MRMIRRGHRVLTAVRRVYDKRKKRRGRKAVANVADHVPTVTERSADRNAHCALFG